MPKQQQNKRVILSHAKIKNHLVKFKKEQNVDFPELAGKLGFPKDSVPTLRIKAASLSDHVRVRTIAERASIMAVKILETLKDRKNLAMAIDVDQINKELRDPVHEKAFVEISIFHRCVVRPKFTIKESYQISEVMPEIINRVAQTALRMSALENINDD